MGGGGGVQTRKSISKGEGKSFMNYEHGNPLPSERNGFFGTYWNGLFSYIVKTMIKNSSTIIKLSKLHSYSKLLQ